MTMKYLKTAVLILALSALAAPAYAMPGGKAMRSADPAERFASMDTSKDGKLTWEEFSAARPNLNENAFKMIDADQDKAISLDEWKAFSSGHGGAAKSPDMGAMMKSMGGMGGMKAPAASAPHDHAPAKPLIMPPTQHDHDTAPAANSAMPLIMPPKSGN